MVWERLFCRTSIGWAIVKVIGVLKIGWPPIRFVPAIEVWLMRMGGLGLPIITFKLAGTGGALDI